MALEVRVNEDGRVGLDQDRRAFDLCTDGKGQAVVNRGDEYLRAWAIQLAVPSVPQGKDPTAIPGRALEKLVDLAANDSSSLVRLYVASAL